MGNPQSTGSPGGDGELICRRPHKRLPTAATDMTTANTKMIPNACNTILLSSLTVS